MLRTDVVFELIAKTLGLEQDAKELHALLELYALAYVDDLEATEDLSAARAHWYDRGSLSCRCSGCGGKSNKESAFCPNCGVRMDKEG